MKKSLIVLSVLMIVGIVFINSCNTQAEVTNEPEKIENTLVSVSYFMDTLDLTPVQLKDAFDQFNASIAEIGYPDAGYKIWIIQEDTSDIEYMVQGNWPNQEIYKEIHNHELYKKASEEIEGSLGGMVWVEYHRFKTIE